MWIPGGHCAPFSPTLPFVITVSLSSVSLSVKLTEPKEWESQAPQFIDRSSGALGCRQKCLPSSHCVLTAACLLPCGSPTEALLISASEREEKAFPRSRMRPRRTKWRFHGACLHGLSALLNYLHQVLAVLTLAGNFRARKGWSTELAAVTAQQRRDNRGYVKALTQAKDSGGFPWCFLVRRDVARQGGGSSGVSGHTSVV